MLSPISIVTHASTTLSLVPDFVVADVLVVRGTDTTTAEAGTAEWHVVVLLVRRRRVAAALDAVRALFTFQHTLHTCTRIRVVTALFCVVP
jgi:hypothetical protein